MGVSSGTLEADEEESQLKLDAIEEGIGKTDEEEDAGKDVRMDGFLKVSGKGARKSLLFNGTSGSSSSGAARGGGAGRDWKPRVSLTPRRSLAGAQGAVVESPMRPVSVSSVPEGDGGEDEL